MRKSPLPLIGRVGIGTMKNPLYQLRILFNRTREVKPPDYENRVAEAVREALQEDSNLAMTPEEFQEWLADASQDIEPSEPVASA
jgi:hypothetical protein